MNSPKSIIRVETYGGVVREVRLLKGISMGGLARMLGVTPIHISEIEQDRCPVRASEHHAIDMAIGITEHAKFKVRSDTTVALVHTELAYEVHDLVAFLAGIDRAPFVAMMPVIPTEDDE